MSNMSNIGAMNIFDMDISTYSLQELEKLLNLPTPYTIELINSRREDLKNKINSMPNIDGEKRKNIISFLDSIHKKIMDNFVKDKLKTNTGKLVNSNNYPDGHINPINIKTIKKAINIDSLFRPDYYSTKSSNFSITLPERINKIVSMYISSIQIPLSYYSISPSLENDYFFIQLLDSSGQDISGSSKKIVIPPGNYESQTSAVSSGLIDTSIETAIKSGLIEAGGDISNNVIFTVDRINGRSNFSLDPSANSNNVYKIRVYFNQKSSTYPGSLLSSSASTATAQIDSIQPLTFKLGWGLGFRAGEYTGSSIWSEGICYITGPRYLFLAINDYQTTANNYFSATYSDSIMAPNIISRINIGSMVDGGFLYKSGQDDDFGDHFNRSRDYFGPVDIQRLTFTLYDEFGRVIDLNNMDWSLVLGFECIYD